MGLGDDLKAKVKEIFQSSWTDRDGNVVPGDNSIGLGNDAVKLDAVVLYADLVESTDLVNNRPRKFAAEVYKTYLFCAARVIGGEGGTITAYDGDRIMAVFLGGTKNTDAARAALRINYVVTYIVNPALATFRCELGGRQPVFVRIASRESCPNAQVFVDGGASDARW